ncbi:hypothetical protein [Massilia sp. erpn]|uniref:hypothetical protein n=1 Tax=Massilia sp. erpn TaxID=2738142 RepID=UPI002105064B|nr:hypothetical protein [Massilia sp. erpn]UTY59052.1 hypothetical protein HPQ68_18840 [Massilia sp. erpn]
MEALRTFDSVYWVLQALTIAVLVMHALALIPQWHADYYNPRFMRRTSWGMMFGIAQGLLLILSMENIPQLEQFSRETFSTTLCLGLALALNLFVALQNVLAALAYAELHHGSAVMAQRMSAGVRPALCGSALLSLAAYLSIRVWL